MSDDESKPGIGSLKTLVEILAIVIGGCWVFFQYLSHEREAAKLTLEQQRLATQQAAAVSGTEIAAETARLEQLKLSNSQTRLTVDMQTKTQSMAVDQQRLATEQVKLSLAIAESQRKLRDVELQQNVRLQEQEILLRKLQNEKAAHEVDYQGKYRFDRSFTLEGEKLRDIDQASGEYAVKYGFEFTNKSEVDFEVSLFVIDYYIGIPSNKARDSSVMPIGTPADRWNPTGAENGAIEWKRVGHVGSVYAASAGAIQEPWDYAADVENLTRGGGGTATLKPAQSLHYDDTYFVRAPKNAYVAFVISYCFNRCATNEDLYSQTNWLSVDELEIHQSQTHPK